MTRRGRALLFLPVALALALAGAVTVLLNSQAGARWIWSHASAMAQGSLRAADVRGDLLSGLTLRQVSFANESASVAAGTVQLRLGFDLFPFAVSVETLKVDRLAIRVLTTAPATPEQRFDPNRMAFSSPVSVNFETAELDQLVYEDAEGTTTIQGSAIHFSGRWYEELILREISFHTPGADWKGRVRIGLSAPYPVDAAVDSRFEPSASGTPPLPAVHAVGRLTGKLSDFEVQAELEQPSATLRGHLRGLPDRPNWDLNVRAEALQWPLRDDEPQVTLKQFSAHSSGSLEHFEVKAGGALGIIGLPVMATALKASGDSGGIRIENLRMSSERLQLNAHGPVSWTAGFKSDLTCEIGQLDPRLWLSAWPAEQPLKGRLEVIWQDDRAELSHFDLATESSGFSLHGNGVVDLAADVVEANLNWQSVRWPPGAQAADFSSDNGSLRVRGKPEDWTVTGMLQVKASHWPAGSLNLIGNGDMQSVRLQIERGEILGGTFDGRFDYQWTEQQPWAAEVHMQHVDITPLSQGFPGVINGDFSAVGQFEPMEFRIDIARLDGVIRGQPVEARGGVDLKAGEVQARNLVAASGQSNIAIDGNLRSQEGLRVSGRIESLGDWIAGVGGSLQGQGRLSSYPGQPRIELELSGHELSWAEWRIGTLSASRPRDRHDTLATRIDMTNLSYGDQRVDTVRLTASGDEGLDNLLLEASQGETHFEARLAGSMGQWDKLDEVRWHGNVEALRLHNETLGYLQLEEAAELAIDGATLDFGPACLRGSRNGRICLDASSKSGGYFTTSAKLEAISLKLVELVLGTHLEFSQTLAGEIQWRQMPGKMPTAKVRIEVSPGQIAYEDEDTAVRTGPGLLEFQINEGQLLAGHLDIAIPGVGNINSDFSGPDITRGIDSVIEGRIQVKLDQIEPLLNWIPQVVDPIAGTVNADVRLSGTLADPQITGHASLVRGRYEHPATGTVITDIQLAGAVYKFDFTELNGSFKAGEGRGQIKATVKFDDIFKPDVNLQLSGSNLNLVDVPDMAIRANPDLQISWHEGLLGLNGHILIPLARISPRYMPTASAVESSDLTVVGGGTVTDEEATFDRSKLRVKGSVVVELGKDVTVTVDRATAQLRGKATFTWDNNLLPTADGTYTVSGKLYTYGQLLEVAEGRVSFPHVPADNPYLNINAEREIYGNMQIRQAGVHISGTVRQPIMEPYTTPLTTRERALTLLLTGHDFDYEQGVGGVEVGMYIAPRLYVSYGIGLFESQSVISARYDLKHGFGVKATSGQRETGGDITYTIER